MSILLNALGMSATIWGFAAMWKPAQICRIIFALLLVVNLIWAVLIGKVINLLPISKYNKTGWSLSLASTAFWLTIKFCPWINYICSNDVAAVWKETFAIQAKTGRPVFVIGTHVSFIDTPFVSSTFPFAAAFKCKTYMKQALLDIPVLGALAYNCGQFVVPYVKDDSFSVQAEKMAQVDATVDEHVASGGWLCFFPEGQLNKNPDAIQEIRHGGMKRAIKYDAILLSAAYYNNEAVWPLKAAVGGLPAEIRWSMKQMAPGGTKALMESLMANAKKSEKGNELPDYEILAEHVKSYFQKQYDELKKEAVTQKELANKKKKAI